MTALIRAQVALLGTLRSTYVVAGALIAVATLITGITMSEAGSPDLRTESQLREPLVASAGIMVAVVLAILTATRIAGEYRHASIAQRMLAAPRRLRLVSAALLVHGTFAAFVSAAAFVACVAITGPTLTAPDLSTGLTGAELARVGAAVVLAGTAFGMLGTAVGFLTRSPAAAVVTVFSVFFVEKLVGPTLGEISGYLPYALLNSLLELDGPISVGAAAAALAVTTVALSAMAAVMVERRDVV